MKCLKFFEQLKLTLCDNLIFNYVLKYKRLLLRLPDSSFTAQLGDFSDFGEPLHEVCDDTAE